MVIDIAYRLGFGVGELKSEFHLPFRRGDKLVRGEINDPANLFCS
jgi:hypothetical protein